MSLKDQITEDMKTAMRARDADRLSAIRMLLAALKQKEVDERVTLTDADVLVIVDKLLKQRRDSLSQFEAAGREDLAAKERLEIDVLGAYLPRQLSGEEVQAEIDAVIAELSASGVSGNPLMGKTMGALKGRLAGKADMTQVSALVKTRLSQG